MSTKRKTFSLSSKGRKFFIDTKLNISLNKQLIFLQVKIHSLHFIKPNETNRRDKFFKRFRELFIFLKLKEEDKKTFKIFKKDK